jgi:hypothetical protein
MKVDPVSIYTREGLIQPGAHLGASSRVTDTGDVRNGNYHNGGRSDSASSPQGLTPQNIGSQNAEGQGVPAGPVKLSPVESARITSLFGRFDANTIQNSGPEPISDNRPGQFIDIVV